MKNVFFFGGVALNILLIGILCFQSFLYFRIDNARKQLQNTNPDQFARIPASNILNPRTSIKKPLYTESFIEDSFCTIKTPLLKDIKSGNLIFPQPRTYRKIGGKLLFSVAIELPEYGKACAQNYQFISLLLEDSQNNNIIVHTYKPQGIGCSLFESHNFTFFSGLNPMEEILSQDWYNTIESIHSSFDRIYFNQAIGSVFPDVVVDSEYRMLYIPDQQVFQEHNLDKDVFLQQLPLCTSL